TICPRACHRTRCAFRRAVGRKLFVVQASWGADEIGEGRIAHSARWTSTGDGGDGADRDRACAAFIGRPSAGASSHHSSRLREIKYNAGRLLDGGAETS